jgi:hypothetical protein
VNKWILSMSATLGVGCAPDITDNAAARCAGATQCDDGFQCYRGFCVADDRVPASSDAGGRIPQAGSAASGLRDAGSAPDAAPTVGADGGAQTEAGVEVEPSDAGTLEPGPGEQASPGEDAAEAESVPVMEAPEAASDGGGHAHDPEAASDGGDHGHGNEGGRGSERADAAEPGRADQSESQTGSGGSRGNARGRSDAGPGSGKPEEPARSTVASEGGVVSPSAEATPREQAGPQQGQNTGWPSFGCDVVACCSRDVRGPAQADACCPISEVARRYRCEVLRLLGQVP